MRRVTITLSCTALHCVEKTTGARVWKTPTGKQIQGRPAAGVSRSANMDVGVYGNCLSACDSILRWKPCTAGWYPTRNAPNPARCHGIPPPHGCRRVRRGRLESSAAVFVGEATVCDRIIDGSGDGYFYCFNETGSVQWKPKLAPAVSGVFGGSGSSRYIEDGIALMRGRGRRLQGRSRCTSARWFGTSPSPVHRGTASTRSSGLRRGEGPGSGRTSAMLWARNGCLYALSISVAAPSVT